MSKTVSLPNRDRTRKLSPLVLEAVSNGAIASLDPADPNGTLILTFDKPAQAKAFKAMLTPDMMGIVGVDPASDLVDESEPEA